MTDFLIIGPFGSVCCYNIFHCIKDDEIFIGYNRVGDFRSDECTKIKDSEGVIVITNPPFSLFREFIDWLREDERFAGETSLW